MGPGTYEGLNICSHLLLSLCTPFGRSSLQAAHRVFENILPSPQQQGTQLCSRAGGLTAPSLLLTEGGLPTEHIESIPQRLRKPAPPGCGAIAEPAWIQQASSLGCFCLRPSVLHLNQATSWARPSPSASLGLLSQDRAFSLSPPLS